MFVALEFETPFHLDFILLSGSILLDLLKHAVAGPLECQLSLLDLAVWRGQMWPDADYAHVVLSPSVST